MQNVHPIFQQALAGIAPSADAKHWQAMCIRLRIELTQYAEFCAFTAELDKLCNALICAYRLYLSAFGRPCCPKPLFDSPCLVRCMGRIRLEQAEMVF